MTTGRPRSRSCRAEAVRGILCLGALLFATVGTGCAYVPDELPYAKLAIPYRSTQLKSTTTLDVLNIARDPAYRFKKSKAEPVLLTQSDTVVAYSGQSKDRRKTWLNMIVFDEYRMTATRKYFFCVDERAVTTGGRPSHLLVPPRRGILFDSEFIVGPEVLTTPYATEEAQKTAIVRWLAERFKTDVAALIGSPRSPTQGNEQVTVATMMANQVFQGILVELAQSPGLARNLGDEQGIEFPHLNLDKGRIRMHVANDRAVVTIRVNLPMIPLQER
ncbi:MAG: hypothetical protein A2Y74_02970 [Actinobacteria bacterium RBG_13_63_9]|nr:MAG: hypothetical protein A2Y74_02970 [Actinobacteria bacterium RBG_13_63_9]